MKERKHFFLVLLILFLSPSSFAQTIDFKPAYKAHQIFRYQGTIDLSLWMDQQQTFSQKIEIAAYFRVVRSLGRQAVVALKVEKIKDPSGVFHYPGGEKGFQNFVKGISKSTFLVGPGLQVKKVYGLERMLLPFLEETPLKAWQKNLLLHFFRAPATLLNKKIDKMYPANIPLLFLLHSEGAKIDVRRTHFLKGKLEILYAIKKITGRGASQKALCAVERNLKYGPLYRLFGYDSTNMKGELEFNQATIPLKIQWSTTTALQPYPLSPGMKNLLKALGIPIPKEPKSMAIKSQINFKLLPSAEKKLHYKIQAPKLSSSEKKKLLEKTRRIIFFRLNLAGVEAFRLVTKGEEDLILFLPPDAKMGEVQRLVERPGKLSFKLVHRLYQKAHSIQSSPHHLRDLPEKDRKEIQNQIQSLLAQKQKGTYQEDKNPLDLGIYAYSNRGNQKNFPTAYILLENTSPSKISGLALKDVKLSKDSVGKRALFLEFQDQEARKLSRLTGNNLRRKLAIVLDGKILSMPVVMSRITGGKAMITGNFSEKELKRMRALIKTSSLWGALPVPLKRVEGK